MDENDVKPGLRVRVYQLEDASAMLIAPEHMRWRRIGAIGIVERRVMGHGGDAWWVRQDDGQVAAYWYDELEPAPLRRQ